MSRVRESVFPACDSSSILRGHLCLVARVGMEGVGRRGSDQSHLPQAVFYTESHGVFRKDRGNHASLSWIWIQLEQC